MKKLLVLLVVSFLLIGSVSAMLVSFDSKIDALAFLRDLKLSPPDFSQDAFTITFLTDKICHINHETEEVSYCEACVKFEFVKPNTYTNETHEQEECFELPEDSTVEEDNLYLRQVYQERIPYMFPKNIAPVSYVKHERKGDII
jgi:hypothetical protein